MSEKRFYGKYGGTVSDNQDPLSWGRIKARVPAVYDTEETGWALPSTPYAGSGVGFYFIPPVGAKVWIEFEDGKTDSPIWSGCYWATPLDLPKLPALPFFKVIKTDKATITIDDLLGGVTIETVSGLKIVMDLTGIELSNSAAKIKLTPVSVSINDGALEVI